MSILNFFKKVDKLTPQDDVAESNSPEPEMDVEYLLNCDENSSMNDEDQLSAEEEKIQEEPSDSAEPVPPKKRSRNFEAIKSYSFQQSWLKQFPWLKIIDSRNQIVSCKLCSQEKMKTAWAKEKPLPTWRVDFFKYHETKDKGHIKAVENIKARPKQIIENASNVAREKMCGQIMRCLQKVLFVVQKNLPISTSTDLHDLVLEFSNQINIKSMLPSHHQSNFSTYQFIEAINQDVFEKEIKKLKESVGFTLHIDESTDITEEKQMMVYITNWDQISLAPKTSFLTLLPVAEAKAVPLAKLLVDFFKANKIPLTKILHFTSDGAAVMLGKHGGVAALLRNSYGLDHLTDFHCVAHREALAMKDVLQASLYHISHFVIINNNL